MTSIALSKPSNVLVKAIHALVVYYYWGVLKFILTYFALPLAAIFLAIAVTSGNFIGALQGLAVLLAFTSAIGTLFALIFEAAR